ncbi:hypothetical protein KNT81_gp210 [Proteus phage phiP4-3]|uniref:Uncharacterized protein n=1 Tax=Proteus phage phiP4-3 TaxID=2065203 RepID=A0A2I6PFS4_9CAUD|nr:hypothetical protein KNT81_gp210 [Proteus phage phiP4-3]AUM58561.1 hypothetical protein phiP43_203 [Proteus phage phiP4-3]AZV01200.1 hypothetical protein vBSdyM006_063 [Shigella phage vB_SdyM_006]
MSYEINTPSIIQYSSNDAKNPVKVQISYCKMAPHIVLGWTLKVKVGEYPHERVALNVFDVKPTRKQIRNLIKYTKKLTPQYLVW